MVKDRVEHAEMPLIVPLLRRKRRADTISAVYGAIVAQARHAAFYARFGVPDTVDGRLAMIVLHLSLTLQRLAGSGESRSFGQDLFDAFCRDMDHNLREMGVGDLAVPRRMRRIGEEFYGQSAAYQTALSSGDAGALRDALARNVFGDQGSASAARLSLYVERAHARLAGLDQDAVTGGHISFPDPVAARPRHGHIMSERDRPWNYPIAVDEIPESGRRFDLHADEHIRAAIAALARVEAIPSLEAAFEVTRHGRDGLAVTGTVTARVDQVCVVTLEPVQSAIAEPIDLIFSPQSDVRTKDAVVGIDDAAPEPLVDGRIDLGAIATEFLVLAIDPYPRKAGVTFDPPAVPDDRSAHPFAALAALKRDRGADDG